jgi:hypothetical protein
MPNKILYVNSDSHFSDLPHAGAERDPIAVNQTAPGLLARKYGLDMVNQSRPGGSNNRIIRMSKEYLRAADPQNTLVFIAWTQWNRTEWYYQGEWLQISGHPMYEKEAPEDPHMRNLWGQYSQKVFSPYPVGEYPDPLYNPLIIHPVFTSMMLEWQSRILEFHHWLAERGFPHIFLHGDHGFSHTPMDLPWPKGVWIGDDPYDWSLSFCNYSRDHGYHQDEFCHYGVTAHKEYSQFIEPWVTKYLGLA